MKVRAIIRTLEAAGWVLTSTKGSHRQYKHPARPGKVTAPGKPNDDLPPGLLRSIRRQAGME
ncbi:MAG: type II toxin-antitoxin system HicA family toxin [SAR324 cluster bacterium]|nr:type II toxin-antitoxin system HicA family toxin [SAR324 cluster bacterium]